MDTLKDAIDTKESDKATHDSTFRESSSTAVDGSFNTAEADLKTYQATKAHTEANAIRAAMGLPPLPPLPAPPKPSLTQV